MPRSIYLNQDLVFPKALHFTIHASPIMDQTNMQLTRPPGGSLRNQSTRSPWRHLDVALSVRPLSVKARHYSPLDCFEFEFLEFLPSAVGRPL